MIKLVARLYSYCFSQAKQNKQSNNNKALLRNTQTNTPVSIFDEQPLSSWTTWC